MECRHLRYFLVLSEELHFGRAAQRLAMTQPPLSLNSQQLEEAVGARLFERDSKGVRLTAAGEGFRSAAQALLAQAEDVRALARDIGAGAAGRLRIGSVGSMLFRGLPQWFREFQVTHPRIEITLTELNSQEQIDAVVHRELDLGFVHTGRVPAELQTEKIDSERFRFCLPADHPLTRRRAVSLIQLRHEPFILFSQKASPDYFARIVETCARLGFMPRIRHEVRHWLSVVSLVGQRMGVSIVPASLARAGLANVVLKTIAEDLPPSEAFYTWKRGPELPIREAFLGVILQGRSIDP